ncbi:P-loop containing nucleoside triphosphate hydrolase protein [Melanogaster broomeanus]|nr:P-loop containing nucleoside triphosphate hydrolase protein [Melanogaster broomeanus]
MAKKKKTQLPSIRRGFATTSIPKKVVQVEEVEPPSDEPPTSSGSMAEVTPPGEMSSVPPAPTADTPGPRDEFDADQAEEQSLQNMIEKFQEKTEREITRTIKAIEVEKRTSKDLTTLHVDPVLVDQVLQLQLQEDTSEVQRNIEQTEEKAATRLAITYGVSRRLGFSEDWVDQCLHAIQGVELDEALEWLFVRCPESELQTNEDPEKVSKSHKRKHRTPILTQEPPAKPVESRSSTPRKLDANAPPFVPSFNPAFVNQTPHHQEASANVSTTQSSECSSPEPEDPNMEYARIKMRLMDIKTSKVLPKDQKLDATNLLEEELRNLKSHYFFDQRDAEQRYRSERDKANAQLLQESLRRSADPPQATDPEPKSIPVIATLPPQPASQSDVFDQEDDESSGGLLEILDTLPSEVQGSEGTTIRRGKLPKAILMEYVSKIDRYAAVTFNLLSGAGRAKRAGVRVLWEGRKVDEWRMDDIACHDESQAEQYIAMVALHALSFPTTEGFAAGTMTSPVGNTFFRLFPPAFRNLWDELEADRKVREDRINRGVWAKMRSIVEEKIDVTRSTHRNSLPIAQYREEINTILRGSQTLVLCGETGCGKSTQVPAFILEDQLSRGQPCKIYCTEPRRISAVSLAQRVSRELGDPPGAVGTLSSLVGYSIRLESNTTKNTRLAYVTNGIALRMLEGGSGRGGQGTAFDEITHIIIDEVHERTIESDFLLVVLKSLLAQRPDLKIVLMSATVDADKISNFFGGCPVLHVPGRTFPVDVLYLEDAIQCTGWSISEDSPFAKRRRDKFYQSKGRTDWDERTTKKTVELLDERIIPYELIVRLLDHLCFGDTSLRSFSSAVLIFMPGLAEIRRLGDLLSEHPSFGDESWFRVYPLHSTLSSDSQNAVFDMPPTGVRKIVIATNIAETGITIPDITCVIDTGKQREMMFDEKRQLSRLVETFVAKSNAAQRRGRAGRVQHGICFHLFTKQRHDTVVSSSLSDLALRIKTMKVKIGNSIEDVLCRALDPPTPTNVQRAIAALVEVRALTPTEDITPMGRLLSKLPTDVHLGKFLLTAVVFRCLDPALTIAAALNSKSPFITPLGLEQEADRAKSSFRVDNSDFLTIHNAFASWRRASANPGFVRKFCRKNFLSHENLLQIEDLRQQFLGYLVDSSFLDVDKGFVKELSRVRFGRNKNRFVTIPPELDSNSGNHAVVNAALLSGLYPKLLYVDPAIGLHPLSNNQLAFFHPSSVNFRRKPKDLAANYLAYFTLMHSKKLYAWETGPMDDLAILLLCGECDFKLISDTAIVDRKIKYRLTPKANVAMKILRNQLSSIAAQKFRGKPMTESQVRWHELAMTALGRVKLDAETDASTAVKLVLR